MSMTRTLQVIAGTYVTLCSNQELPKIMKIEGMMNGVSGTQYFLQIHNLAFASLSSGVTVPLRSLQVLGVDGFTFQYQPEGLTLANLPGVLAGPPGSTWIVALSTTDAVYTAPTSQTADINVDIEEYEIEFEGATNLSGTPANYVQVVADTLGNTQRLLSMTLTANTNACYVQLFAKAPTAGAVPLEQLDVPGVTTQLLPVNTPITFNFGSGGKSLFSQDANGKGHYGIFVAFSLTSGSYDVLGSASVSINYR